MNKKILLYQLRALLEIAPDFNLYHPDSEMHSRWMNSIHTLIYQWKPFPAIAVASAIEFMPGDKERSKNIEQLFNIAYHAVEQLQVEVETSLSSGAASNPTKDLSTLMSTANERLLIVDSECDIKKLEFYLDSLQEQVQLRLLLSELSAEAIVELKKIAMQSGALVEVKVATTATEKIIFVDELNSWGSIDNGHEDNLQLSDTLAPLSPELTRAKRDHYESAWATAQSV